MAEAGHYRGWAFEQDVFGCFDLFLTSQQRSDHFFCEVQSSAEIWVCPPLTLTRSIRSALLRVISLISFVLLVYRSNQRWWLFRSGLFPRWITAFPVFRCNCCLLECGKVDLRLVSDSANSFRANHFHFLSTSKQLQLLLF